MADKKNFKSYEDAEEQLYRISKLLLEGKVTPPQATSFANIVNSWVKTKKMEDGKTILNRIEGLESLFKANSRVV